MEETIYDRKRGVRLAEPGLKGRTKALLGLNARKIAKTAPSWKEVILAPLKIMWRPQFIGIWILEGVLFGFAIGINITNTVFFQSPPPFGFGFDSFTVGGIYATPVAAVFIGEIVGRYSNDWLMYASVRRNNGVFEAESRLWAVHVSVLFYLCGFLILGAALQHHLHIAVIVVGWGIAQLATFTATVAVYAYSNDCFPRRQGEVSSILNLARILGGLENFTYRPSHELCLMIESGFAVAYYQVPWAEKNGAMQTLGVEAGIVCALFLLIVPVLQLKGREFRRRFSFD
ncbi:hypothetical protein PQX77_009345 [Marasmius sp. AFHP31]|nr:hypothetical protein PQX77_009345 [Marasmius sp. AFHP31]